MLTHEDIQLLTEYQKTVFATKEDLAELREELGGKIDNLTNMVDSFAKESKKNSEEIVALGYRVTKTEKNLETVAKKVEVELEY